MPRRRVPHNHLATERTVTSAPGNQHKSAAAAEHVHSRRSAKAVQFSSVSAKTQSRHGELWQEGLCAEQFSHCTNTVTIENLRKVPLNCVYRFLKERLEVAEIKTLRLSLGVNRLHRIRNEYIRRTRRESKPEMPD